MITFVVQVAALRLCVLMALVQYSVAVGIMTTAGSMAEQKHVQEFVLLTES